MTKSRYILMQKYQEHIKGQPLRVKAHFWFLIVITSPIWVALLLGAWAEGWLDRRTRG